MKVVDRYVAGLVLRGALASLGIIGGLLILHRFYKIIELAVTRSLSLGESLTLVIWIFPLILFHALPIAVVVGIFLAFGQLAAAAELHAFLAAGIGRVRLALFPLLLSGLITVGALVNSLTLVPLSYVQFDSVGFGVGIDPMKALRPGQMERIQGRHITVGAIDPERQSFGRLFAVIPSPFSAQEEEAGRRFILTARAGNWVMERSALHLDLIDGSLREFTTGAGGRTLSFANYRLLLPLPRDRSPDPKRLPSATLARGESRAHTIELVRRFLSALIIPILSFCAVPLSTPADLSAGKRNATRGAVWHSFLLYLLYSVLLFSSDALVEKYGLAVPLMALPHAILALLGIGLWTLRR